MAVVGQARPSEDRASDARVAASGARRLHMLHAQTVIRSRGCVPWGATESIGNLL